MTNYSNKKYHIAVIGCGTAGPAAALLLQRAGHSVEIFETVPEPGPVGAGILLQPTGIAVLDRLTLKSQALQLGAMVHRLRGHTNKGRKIFDLAYRDLQPDYFGLGIHRGTLFSLLMDNLKQADIVLHTGVEICQIDDKTGLQAELTDNNNQRYGPYDLVIVANGTQSQLRQKNLLTRMQPYPWGAVWTIAADPEERFAGSLAQVYCSAGVMIGILPTGRLPQHPDGPLLVSFFWSLPVATYQAWLRGDFAQWKQQVLQLWPDIAVLVEQFQTPQALAFASYSDVRMRSWATDRVVYLGDAAHAMSPQLGQGANLALIDAMVLADSLAAQETIASGLLDYCQQRRRHLRFYQAMSRFLTPFYQSHSRTLGWLRDVSFAPSAKIPYIERQMLATLAGVKNGLFGQMKIE